MFGFVMANTGELPKERRSRYNSIYCGICRRIREEASQVARLGLSYDMAFLALLLMSLYEPEECTGDRACLLHPCKSRNWVDNEYIGYAASMNIALAYYKALDDYEDDGSVGAKLLSSALSGYIPKIREKYPRQCQAMEECIHEIRILESQGCKNPDEPAGSFGRLMAALFTYREDMWAEDLQQMGIALGRFIYLADAAVDYRADKKKHAYNPFIAMGMDEDFETWDKYLTMAMARCTKAFEHLPLVQDKDILDNILYSGVWIQYRARQKKNSSGGNGNE